jgi:hypothetical protein
MEGSWAKIALKKKRPGHNKDPLNGIDGIMTFAPLFFQRIPRLSIIRPSEGLNPRLSGG